MGTTAAAMRQTSPAGHDDRRSVVNDDVCYAAGQLTARIDPTGSGSTKTTLYFTSPGGGLAEEASGSGQTMVRHLTTTAGTTLAEESWRTTTTSRAATATWAWLLPDSDGNVATVVDDAGAVKEQTAYDPYGAPRAGGSSKASGFASSSLGYQAALTDRDEAAATRAVILTDRQYDPRVRRFTSLDTYAAADLDLALATDPLTGNRYLYAAANPVALTDDGHYTENKSGVMVAGDAPSGRSAFATLAVLVLAQGDSTKPAKKAKTCGGKQWQIGRYGRLPTAPDCQRHHIIQEAAVKGLVGPSNKKYSKSRSPAILLTKPAHQAATNFQNKARICGTYGDEQSVAVQALAAAAVPAQFRGAAISEADSYFLGELGFTLSTTTRTPGRRKC